MMIGRDQSKAPRSFGKDKMTPPDTFASISQADAICLAIATEGDRKLKAGSDIEKELQWLRSIPADIAVVSVVGPLNLTTLRRIVGERPTARFQCSPAIASDSKSLRFYDSASDTAAVSALTKMLPSPAWVALPGAQFERFSRLLVSSALVCACLLQFLKQCDDELTEKEKSFLLDNLQEAGRLITGHGGDLQKVLIATGTPGGMTRKFAKRIFKSKINFEIP